jgi:phosphoribosylanthranilate isomerase
MKPPVRVKVCGLRSPADLLAARGADAVGFVVASPTSKRDIAPSLAARLAAQVPPFVQSVLVTRETHPARLAALQGAVPTGAIQVHGLRTSAEAQAVRKAVQGPLLLAAPVSAEWPDVPFALAAHADALLLDSRNPDGTTGGSGVAHDWKASARIVRALDTPVVLAGGLTPANVAQAIRQVKPWAVDVSGGVEGSKGKSKSKVARFLQEARTA